MNYRQKIADLLELTTLSDREREAFEEMADLASALGDRGLSERQRTWIDRARIKHEIDADEEPENMVTSGKVRGSAGLPPAPWEQQPKPLRPPGRR